VQIVSPILRERKLALAIFISGIVLLGLFAFGVTAWPCPFLHVTGIPCPGCGLTRATYFLLHGDFRTAMRFHAFAPVLVLALAATGIAGALPAGTRETWVSNLETFERRSGIGLILLVGFMGYWVGRLIFLNADFVHLIRG
jgi:hypothetical protein